MEIRNMTLEDKVAQLFAFSAFSSILDDSTKKLITDLHVGGIFLGTECLKEPEQVFNLTTTMQKVSIAEGSGIPLFISADFVAGAGCKLQSGAVHFPKNRAIGVANDEHLAYELGKITAKESLAMGVNFNYSPVLDINNNPLNPVIGTHSFGEDKEIVSRLGNAVIRGYQEHGLIATAKHFPGHGDTHVDSHEDLPILSFDRERLESFELVPFQRAIEAGVDAVMVGHIAVPNVDPSLKPASLSYELTTKLLREQLEFEGLIVTDGLSMKGITKQYSMEEACIHAILAGADILLGTAENYEQSVSMIEAVVEAVKNGRILESRIHESLGRILTVKQKYQLSSTLYQFQDFQSEQLSCHDAQQINHLLAKKAVTPMNGLKQGYLERDKMQEDWVLIRDQQTTLFAETLITLFPTLEQEIVENYTNILEVMSKLSDRQNVIVAIAHNKPINSDFIKALNHQLTRVNGIWIHFGSEYDVRSTVSPCLLMYDKAPSLQYVAAQYLQCV